MAKSSQRTPKGSQVDSPKKAGRPSGITVIALTAFILTLAAVIAYANSYRNYRKNWRASNWGGWSMRIKACESGGTVYGRANYNAKNPRSSASGAYQIINGTWQGYNHGYKQYSTARSAPPHVQEIVAERIFNANGTRPWNASAHCWRPGGKIKSAPAVPSCGVNDAQCGSSAPPPLNPPPGGSKPPPSPPPPSSSLPSKNPYSCGAGSSGSPHPTLKKDASGSCVQHLQFYLKKLGYDIGNFCHTEGGQRKCDGIDGSFGSKTDSAVRQFQRDKSVAGGADGIVGKNTWNALHNACRCS